MHISRRISRRKFLGTGTALSLAAVSGCACHSRTEKSAPVISAAHAAPAGAQVAMVRAGDGLEGVNRAIELAGGLDFIEPGQKVLLKPAMNSSNPFPATTDPAVVALVIDICRERGASAVAITDKPFFLRSAEAVFEKSGIGPAARRAGADVLPLDDVEWREVAHPFARYWGSSFAVPALLSEYDHIIYLPTVRTHMLTRFTMSLKNSVGLLSRRNCFRMHISGSLPERIAEINLAVRPSFYLLDARKVFVEGGPDSGRELEPGVVIAGKDPVACDALGLALLKTLGTREDIQGRSVWEQRMIRHAVGLGLGVDGPGKIQIRSEGIEETEEIIKNLAQGVA